MTYFKPLSFLRGETMKVVPYNKILWFKIGHKRSSRKYNFGMFGL